MLGMSDALQVLESIITLITVQMMNVEILGKVTRVLPPNQSVFVDISTSVPFTRIFRRSFDECVLAVLHLSWRSDSNRRFPTYKVGALPLYHTSLSFRVKDSNPRAAGQNRAS